MVVVADVLTAAYSLADLEGLFGAIGVPSANVSGRTKRAVCMSALGWASANLERPLDVLGQVLGHIMDEDPRVPEDLEARDGQRDRIRDVLGRHGLAYERAGRIISAQPVAVGLTQNGPAVPPATASLRKESSSMTPTPPQPDVRRVFVIHGRNEKAHVAIDHFLKALKLEPVDFSQVAASRGLNYIGEIVKEGMRQAHGILALFTPDELTVLAPSLRTEKGDGQPRWQSRPNVIFEAGIAFGIAPERTVLVLLGSGVFSDLAGVHFVALNNSTKSRGELRTKLIGIGCAVDQATHEWTDTNRSGDFEACLGSLPDPHTLFGNPPQPPG